LYSINVEALLKKERDKEALMRIAIFGTGGVGGYFGGRLAQAGEDVVFISRGEHLNALRSSGLKVDSIEGDFAIQPVEATDNPAEVGYVDAILVGVKAWQVPEAAEAMQPMVGTETFIVPLQNGVEAPSQLAAVLGQEVVLGGLCRILSSIANPGNIRHMGIAPYVAFGELDKKQSERSERLFEAFSKAEGVKAEISADINADMWKKFLLISAFSGVGAVTQAPIGVVRSQEETRKMLEQVMVEIRNVALARDIALPEKTVDKTMEFFDDLPPGGIASMQRDIYEGRPSELYAQNGAVVRMGQEAGVETPVNAFIYASLLASELRARGELQFAV
jgi:2-dehydropantoate 2-reductase